MNEKPKSISSLVASDYFKTQAAAALPAEIKPERFVRTCLTALLNNPGLGQCTQDSVVSCLMRLAAIGLEPNGHDAHMIPRQNRQKGVMEASLMVDYKGLLRIARRVPGVKKVYAEVIHEKDHFEWRDGEVVGHTFSDLNARGEPVGAYAVMVIGESHYSAVMSRPEIEAVRAKSESWRAYSSGKTKIGGPWLEFPGEMWRKSALRRLLKWAPTPEPIPLGDGDDESQASFIDVTVAPAEPEPEPTQAIQSTPPRLAGDPKPGFIPSPLEVMCAEANIRFDDWCAWARNLGILEDGMDPDSWGDVPKAVQEKCIKAQKVMIKELQK